MPLNAAKIEGLVRELLAEIGEDPQREGLVKTPQRVAAALAFLTPGSRADATKLINGAIFTQETNSMVIVKNIEVYSLCEHHMLPFFGRCHIGYIPKGRVFGVSKLARLVDMYARRLQLQERLTDQISQAVMDSIDAVGVGVMIEARVLVVVAVDTQQFPIAAVRRIVVVVVVAVVDRELRHVAAIELARTSAADPRIDLERLLAIARRTLLAGAARVGDDTVELRI